jgi:hypothetical protein
MPRGVPIRLSLLMAYLAIPIDVIPDFLPVLGYADDAVIVTQRQASAPPQGGRNGRILRQRRRTRNLFGPHALSGRIRTQRPGHDLVNPWLLERPANQFGQSLGGVAFAAARLREAESDFDDAVIRGLMEAHLAEDQAVRTAIRYRCRSTVSSLATV